MTETIPGCPHGTEAEQGWCAQCEAGVPGSETPQYPAGEYAIVELFGHSTLVGRVEEVDRFGTKMMQIEPIFNGAFLVPVLQGGASIYRFTPCDAATAFKQAPKSTYQLPAVLRVLIPPTALPAPDDHQAERYGDDDNEEVF